MSSNSVHLAHTTTNALHDHLRTTSLIHCTSVAHTKGYELYFIHRIEMLLFLYIVLRLHFTSVLYLITSFSELSLLFFFPSLLLPFQLIRSSQGDVLWFVIAKHDFQHLFYHPTCQEVDDHQRGNRDLEFHRKWDQFELLIDLGYKLRRTRKRNGCDQDNAPVHASVLFDRFSERSSLVIDSKCRYLLDELKQVNCRIQQ